MKEAHEEDLKFLSCQVAGRQYIDYLLKAVGLPEKCMGSFSEIKWCFAHDLLVEFSRRQAAPWLLWGISQSLLATATWGYLYKKRNYRLPTWDDKQTRYYKNTRTIERFLHFRSDFSLSRDSRAIKCPPLIPKLSPVSLSWTLPLGPLGIFVWPWELNFLASAVSRSLEAPKILLQINFKCMIERLTERERSIWNWGTQ